VRDARGVVTDVGCWTAEMLMSVQLCAEGGRGVGGGGGGVPRLDRPGTAVRACLLASRGTLRGEVGGEEEKREGGNRPRSRETSAGCRRSVGRDRKLALCY